MTRAELIREIKNKRSFLCIGLDTDLNLLPECLKDSADPVFEFNKEIIDATHETCVAFKPNIAFYECLGPDGWDALKRTIEYIRQKTTCMVIADAKRGDIGNTSRYYAKTFFEYLNADAVTVAPYMGEDSVTPFQNFDGKWVVLLALTSNPGAMDFQFQTDQKGQELYKKVLKKSAKWGSQDNLMYVVGATRAEGIGEVRKIVPNHFFLVPGVGAQGGSLEDVVHYGWNDDCGLLVNASRSVIYASTAPDYADQARKAATVLQKQMEKCLSAKGWE